MIPTPLTKIDQFYLKREDLNPTGSAKDRALSIQIPAMISRLYTKAVISSTGNAAISANYYCQKHHLDLTIFVSPKITPEKSHLLTGTKLVISPTPIKDAFSFAKKNQAFYLRQSTDPNSFLGYQQIAQELLHQLPQISSIFIPVGSGTTLVGISQKLPKNVPIYIVQPANNCPLASHFDHQYVPEKTSCTDALGVKYLPLKKEVISAAANGLVVQDEDTQKAINSLTDHHLLLAPETALAIAGYYKAVNRHFPVGDYPVILSTGTRR